MPVCTLAGECKPGIGPSVLSILSRMSLNGCSGDSSGALQQLRARGFVKTLESVLLRWDSICPPLCDRIPPMKRNPKQQRQDDTVGINIGNSQQQALVLPSPLPEQRSKQARVKNNPGHVTAAP